MGVAQRLSITLPQIKEVFDARQLRGAMRQIEDALSRITVDVSIAGYAVSADKLVTSQDSLLLVDTSAGAVTITLPEVSQAMADAKSEVNIKKATAGGALIIEPLGADTIDDASKVIVYNKGTSLALRAVVGGWRII